MTGRRWYPPRQRGGQAALPGTSPGREVLEELKRRQGVRATGGEVPEAWLEAPAVEPAPAIVEAPAPAPFSSTCRCGHERGEHVTATASARAGCPEPCPCVAFVAVDSGWGS